MWTILKMWWSIFVGKYLKRLHMSGLFHCFSNGAGFLEIAVNMGRAATLFGLKVEDVVEIVFE